MQDRGRIQSRAVGLTVLLALMAWLPGAEAGKGGQKPGGKPPPAGTIYYANGGLTWTMDAGGGNKTALPASVFGQPSHARHGGEFWWLQPRRVDATWQLFAIRGDGDSATEVQLTEAPLEVRDRSGTPGPPRAIRWSKDDTRVSWVGFRWDDTTPLDPGVYAAEVIWDAAGNLLRLAELPAEPVIDLGFINYPPPPPPSPPSPQYPPDFYPDGGSHDWSPGGLQIVYALDYIAQVRPDAIYIADFTADPPTSTLLATHANGPRWSPDGTRIAFGNPDGISTIPPDDYDNSDRTRILSRRGGRNGFVVGGPVWAPTSKHLAYNRGPLDVGYPDEQDIWRATDEGAGQELLTEDLDTIAKTIAWR